jgi:predicted nucleic acid-binding protein
MKLIANNTVISNFALVARLDLLRNLYGEICITPEICNEIEEGIRCGYDFQKLTKVEADNGEWLFVTYLDAQEKEHIKKLVIRLDIGEASCIAVAKSRKWIFLTDDKLARNVCNSINVKYIGTIGILKTALARNLISIDEGNKLLQIMIDNGYYSPVTRLDSVF